MFLKFRLGFSIHNTIVLRGQEEFRTADHSACLHKGGMTVWKRSILLVEEDLVDNLEGDPVQGARQLQRETRTGAWLMVQSSKVNGTELGVQEWRDSLFL